MKAWKRRIRRALGHMYPGPVPAEPNGLAPHVNGHEPQPLVGEPHILSFEETENLSADRAVYLDVNARMQSQAIALAGDDKAIVFMDEAEVAANVAWQSYERSWSLWKTKVLARLAAEAAGHRRP